MRILFQSDHKPDVIAAKLLLDSKGIPAFIGSERSGAMLGGIFSGTYALWVELDQQYDDARALLDDPDHEVAAPVSLDEYNTFKDQWQRRLSDRLNTLGRFAGTVLVFAAVWALIHFAWPHLAGG